MYTSQGIGKWEWADILEFLEAFPVDLPWENYWHKREETLLS
jgi:hypothetical protein